MAEPCLSCGIVSGRRAEPGGAIAEDGHVHANQDVAYPVPGLVIVAGAAAVLLA